MNNPRKYNGKKKSNLSQQDQTILEWNERMSRLNSSQLLQRNEDNNHQESKTSSSVVGYAGGGMGYAGMYQYAGNRPSFLSTRPSIANSNRPSTAPGFRSSYNSMQPTKYEEWTSRQDIPKTTTTPRKLRISPIVLKEIERCFSKADTSTQDGYLDVEELKGFMAYRHCPITHWEAKKLIMNADPSGEKFISLEQIIFLVFHCGFTTPQEKDPNSLEFQNSLRELSNIGNPPVNFNSNINSYVHLASPRGSDINTLGQNVYNSHRHSGQYIHMNNRRFIHPNNGSVLTENIEMENARSHFEQIAITEQKKKTQEKYYKEYRAGLREGRIVKETISESSNYSDTLPPEYYEPTKWDLRPLESESQKDGHNVLSSSFEYSSIKTNWENQVSRTQKSKEEDTWKQFQMNRKSQETASVEAELEKSEAEKKTEVKNPKAALNKGNMIPKEIKNTKPKSRARTPDPNSKQEDSFLNHFEVIRSSMAEKLGRIFSQKPPIPNPALRGACSKDSFNKDADKNSKDHERKVQNELSNQSRASGLDGETTDTRKSKILSPWHKQASTTNVLFKNQVQVSSSISRHEVP